MIIEVQNSPFPSDLPSTGSSFITVENDQLKTKHSDGSIKVYSTGITPEDVRDIIDGMVLDTPTIDLMYDDVNNTLSAEIKLASVTNQMLSGNIDAAKIDGGIISNGEFNQLNGVTGNIQSQIDGKENTGVAASLMTTHTTAIDPHPNYLTQTEADLLYSGINHSHPVATPSANGFMSSTDKEKIDSIISVQAKKNETYLDSTVNSISVNIPNLAFNVINGKQYSFKITLTYSSAATDTGIIFALTKTAPTSGELTGILRTMTTATTLYSVLVSGFDTAYNLTKSANTTKNVCIFEGHFQCTSDGTITPQFRTEVNGSMIRLLGSGVLELTEV